MTTLPYESENMALDQATRKAVDLILEFSEKDPRDSSLSNNPWKDPKSVFEKLDEARLRILDAAQALKHAVEKTELNDSISYDENLLRAQFMDMITDSFADVLTAMKEGQEVDVDALADCLQSGMELFSEEDREHFLCDFDQEESMGDLTPHEARRRYLGFVD